MVMNRGNSVRYYSSLLRKIVLIIGDIICLYLATSIAMALELGNKQTDKIAFHLDFTDPGHHDVLYVQRLWLVQSDPQKAGRYFS